MDGIINEAETSILDRGILHYETGLELLNTQIKEAENKLFAMCIPSRYTYLCEHLSRILKKHRTKCRKKKAKKFEALLENHKCPRRDIGKKTEVKDTKFKYVSNEPFKKPILLEPNWWVKDLDLKLDDKNIIQDNKMLTGKHIYAAQKLLRFDFPEIIQQTTSLSNEHFYELVKNLKTNKVVQIHNTGNLHWVTSTNIEDKRVFVFDSLYDVINEEILKQVDQIYSMVPLCKKIIYEQSGGVDCGLFAIAFSVDLCYGIDPSAVLYDQSRMHKHLIQCFDKMKLTRFPRFRTDPSEVKPNQSHVSWEWHLPNKIAKRNHLNGNTKHNRGIQPY